MLKKTLPPVKTAVCHAGATPPSATLPRYALHMPQLCPKHAQTMPKICPNRSVIVEILITRLMSHWRWDITVDREGPTVLRTNGRTVVFTGGRGF